MEEMDFTESRYTLPFAKHHAFIVGIDAYQNVSPLQTAVSDARMLATVLEKQQHFLVHPPLLNANGDQIKNLLHTSLPESVSENDRVIFYFAGHGIAADGDDGPAGYIVPVDADPTDVKTFIPMEELQKAVDGLPCRHLLLILDCCFSGAFKWSSQYRAIGSLLPKRIYKERFDRFIQDPAWQVITSAAYDQKALDILHGKATGDRGVKPSADKMPHSPFALALFEGLAGAADAKVEQEGDGVITATELYSYIRDQIEPATIEESQKLRQTPGFFPLRKHDKGEFIFLHPRHRLNLPPIPKRNPYRGLQSFQEADKELFYGRDRVVKDLRVKVESNKFVALCGPSGSGKSSAVKAGLLPLLRDEGFHILPVVNPGVHPLADLEQALQGVTSLQADVNNLKSVLLIDQYEELITRCSDATERSRFVVRLRSLLDETSPGGFKIIVIVRADFEAQLSEGPLKEYWIAGRCTVPPFSVEELKEIILMPTIQEVLIFDPPDLVDSIIEEVVQSPGVLPLLSYTLSEFYEAYRTSGRQDRALKREDYDKLGGVSGTLRTKAGSLYRNCPTGEQNTMRKILLRMVSLEGELSGKRVPIDELTFNDSIENLKVQAVIETLVAERLIIKGRDYIEPAHDALIREWKTLLDWVHTIGEDKIVLNAKLNIAANEYAQSQNVRFLWHDNPHLSVLQQELANPQQWFNAKEITFIEGSIRRKKTLSRIVRAITAVVVVALSALTVWALVSRNRATQNYRMAQANLLSIRAAEILKTDPTKALRLAESAYAILEDEPPAVAQQILSEAFHTLHNLDAFYAKSMQHTGEVTAAIFSPSGNQLLTASRDRTAMLWSLTGNPMDTLRHSEEVIVADFSPGGKFVVTATIDGTVWLWDSTGVPLRTIRQPNEIYTVVFSADQKSLLTSCKDDTARLWSVQGALLRTFAHTSEVFSAVFDSAGQKILTASADHTAKLWGLEGKLLTTMHHSEQVNEAIFSRDGQLILTASRDKSARLWDLQGKLIKTFAHRGEVASAAFSSDGQRIVTASADSTVRLWSVSGKLLATCSARYEVTKAVFSKDGKSIIAVSKDRVATLWDQGGKLIAIFPHSSEVKSAMFSADGASILTSSTDSTAKIWDLRELHLQSLDRPANWAAFAPNGEDILTLSDDRTVRLWNSKRSLVDSLTLENPVSGAAFSPNVESILVHGEEHFAGIWHPRNKSVDSLVHDHDVRSAGFSPNGVHVITVDIDDNARLWNVSHDSPAPAIPLTIGPASATKSAVFSSDGEKILTASTDGFARIWSIKGELLDSLDHGGSPVLLGLFLQRSNQIITCAEDGVTRIWNEKGIRTDSLNTGEVSQIILSPNDDKWVVAVLEDGVAVLWDRNANRSIRFGHENKVSCVTFSPDGKLILTAAIDGVAKLWNMDGECLVKMDNHHKKEIKSAAFSPDGRTMLTAARDNAVHLWWTPRTIFEWMKHANISRLSENEKKEFGVAEEY